MIATHERLALEAERLERLVSSDTQATISRKRRAKEVRKLEMKLRASLDHGRLEEDVRGVKLDKVFSRASTKQAMIARVCYQLGSIMWSDISQASTSACTAP